MERYCISRKFQFFHKSEKIPIDDRRRIFRGNKTTRGKCQIVSDIPLEIFTGTV